MSVLVSVDEKESYGGNSHNKARLAAPRLNAIFCFRFKAPPGYSLWNMPAASLSDINNRSSKLFVRRAPAHRFPALGKNESAHFARCQPWPIRAERICFAAISPGSHVHVFLPRDKITYFRCHLLDSFAAKCSFPQNPKRRPGLTSAKCSSPTCASPIRSAVSILLLRVSICFVA